MEARFRGALACMLVCALFTSASASELPFDVANARTGPLRATFVLVKAPAAWTRSLRIGLASGVTTATTAGLEFDDVLLETETGVQATATINQMPGPFPEQLTAGQTATVTLTATFTARGLYRGELVLRQGEHRRVVALEVNVMAPEATPIEAEGGHAVTTIEPFFGSEKVSAVLQLRNKGHDAVALRSVDLASATRVDSPVSPGMPVQSSTARLTAQGSGLAIEPGAVARVPIEVSGLEEPGVYLVDIAVQAEGHEPEQITVTVYRRKHWLWAMLAIAAGGLAAWGIRSFTSGGEDRLKQRRQLAVLRDRLRALRHQVVEPEHEAVAARLSAELERYERELRWVDLSGIKRDVATLELRVELLGDILAAAGQVRRLDADRQSAPRNTLSMALAKVRVQSSDEEINEMRTAVADLAIEESWRSQLTAALGKLDAQVAAQLERGSEALSAAITTQVQPVQILAHNLLRQEHLAEAAEKIKDAQARLRELMVGGLRREVNGAPPPGVSEVEWARVRTDLRLPLAGAPEWEKEFQAAQRTYFRTVIKGLARYAEEKAKGEGVQPSDAKRCSEIAAELTSLLESGDARVDEAAVLYQRRLREIEDASTPAAGRLEIGARSDSREGGERSGWPRISLLPSPVPERGASKPPPTVAQIEVSYRSTSWLVHAGVVAIAVASGMKALWIGNPTWGADHAWLIAFLWGAGVGAVGDAFTGIVGLREKLGGSPP